MDKLKEVIDDVNNYFGQDLTTYISNLITTWKNDGTLGNLVINNLNRVVVEVENFSRLTGETDDTNRIQRAINFIKTQNFGASQGGKLSFSGNTYTVKQLNIPSDIIFFSDKGAVIQSIDAGVVTEGAMFQSMYPAYNLKNVVFDGLTFDGNKDNITYSYYQIIGIWVTDGYRLDGLTIKNCTFKNSKEDCIKVVGKDSTAKADNIVIQNNRFLGRINENSTYSGNALRIVLNRYTSANYGYIFATNVKVHNNYAEYIRTLADIKRGVSKFIITDNTTKNLYDIDISSDGSYYGIIANNVLETEETFVPTNGDNSIEVQGEYHNIYGNVITFKKTNGISITDYGHPDEGGNLGHTPRNIKIYANLIKKVGGVGIKAVNPDGLDITENTIVQCQTPIVVDSGTGRNYSGGGALTAGKSFVANNRMSNYSYGLSLKGSNPILGSGNIDDNGMTPVTYNASTYVPQSGKELNPNSYLDIDTTTSKIKFFNSGENVVSASTKPNGTYNAVTVSDTSTTSMASVTNTDFKIPAKANDIIHIGLSVLKNTSADFGINIKEYNGTTWIKNNFIQFLPSTSWQRFRTTYKVTDPTCDNVVIDINPSRSYNDNTNTGKTDIALFNISKHPIN
jgi:hypothetical protein